MKKSMLLILAVVLFALALPACRQGKSDRVGAGDDSVITEARLLRMDRQAGYTLVTVLDPWQEGRVLQRYVLVPRDSMLPARLPEGTLVRTPVRNALVYSAVQVSLLSEIGAFDAVHGVTDSRWFTDSATVARIASGDIVDCGSSENPTVEKVIAMQPDAVLLSPYQDANYGQITKLGVPIIECADYMEYTPLGRAEWVKFYGELVGRRAQADSLYAAVADSYNEVKKLTSSARTKPTIVTEMVISNVWNIPGGKSYMARIMADAGGTYLWADDDHTGSLSYDFNRVLERAHKADFWLIKWTGINTLADLKAAYALNSEMDAYRQKHVYVCDTDRSRFFEVVPYHPDVLLREFAAVMHPDLLPGYQLRLYRHLDQ